MHLKAFGIIKTTSNIRTSLSSSILCEVWAKPIMFIVTYLGESLTTLQVEVK